jgi:hypothetical protein
MTSSHLAHHRLTRRNLHVLAAAAAVGLSGLPARGAEGITPISFDPLMTVASTRLIMNGHGSRKKAYFWMYDLALYLPSKAYTAEKAVAMEGPKVLSFVARRDLPGGDLGRLFVKGMGQNATPDAMQRHVKNVTRLIEVFAGKPMLHPGDDFRMEYVPGKGTTFFITGQPQGEPVGDAEFFAMALNIWLGHDPADDKLKAALLGA